MLTRDSSDTFTLEGDDHSLTLRGDRGNLASNSRVIAWQPGRTPTPDNESCLTADRWNWPAQEGVALRVASQDGRTRAITVTKNVWGHATNVFNVHVWDTATPEQFRLVRSFNLTPALRGGDGVGHRLCGRTDGTTVTLKVWSVTEVEPAWDDPTATRTVELPATWSYPGLPGVYVGHVEPGTSLSVTDLLMGDGNRPGTTTTTEPDTTGLD